jgi:hypothetical protein
VLLEKEVIGDKSKRFLLPGHMTSVGPDKPARDSDGDAGQKPNHPPRAFSCPYQQPVGMGYQVIGFVCGPDGPIRCFL